ncbi:uncharacterized protein N7496_002487 [Penicillium cataractarum]|uniref:FAD-binding PCMH-type domain-containing protein n=1 Tax=Penicillium cataractarum TaxID=2100454 RepID=A0A9W9SML9_9EURO|nr:uncharacterized protein N7496_002487 [Penicillium cataractarum]KAJ5380059.1 hypothetical protein N7496_002487 [Penicillium cataractarum]
MAPSVNSGDRLAGLESFLRSHQIPYYTPSHPAFLSFRATYIRSFESVVPLCIVRPSSADEVAIIIKHVIVNEIPFTIRAGGHDLFGRCFVTASLAVDLQDLKSVEISDDRRSAKIGGGVLAGRVAEELGLMGLMTAMGSVPSVGYVGWATHGGAGDLVEADEGMLEVIRGAGGTIGVVVEMTIAVFPLKEVSGIVAFSSVDMASTVRRFTVAYQAMMKDGIDRALGIQQSIVNTPGGKVFAVGFMWSSDNMALGREYLERITSFGEVINNTVKGRSAFDWMTESSSLVPESAYGTIMTLSLRSITEEVIEVISHHVSKMPQDPATLISIHQLRNGPALSPAALPSVFVAKEPHYMVELIATSSTYEAAEPARNWAAGCRDALRKPLPVNLLDSTYISLTSPTEADPRKIFGWKWKRLLMLKARYDPKNVFSNAMPQFTISLLDGVQQL